MILDTRAGTTYFDTSPDGSTWNNFASTANAFNVTSLVVGAEVGTWSSEGSTTTAVFDNFNTWQPVYTYDANGNMTSDGKQCYEYNEANQLSKVKDCVSSQVIAEYVYDYTGNRMVKKNYTNGSLANTVISWGDSYETKIINGGGTENTSYYFANGQLIAKKNPDGSKYYYHNDHLGSASVMTDQSGNVVESTSYDPWGEVKSGGTKSKFLYTGQEKDSETNLNYYNARYYDSHIRRFTQPDDIIQDAFNPQSLNRYSYVQNNPLKYTDPTGHINEILAYNNALNQYYKAPSKQNYNNVFAVAKSIQTQSYSPEKDKEKSNGGGAKDSLKPVAKQVYNTLIGNDIKTFQSPNATFAQKGLAGISILGTVVPPLKGVKGIKAATKVGNEVRAGEFQFSKFNPGRVDEYHGNSLDGTSEGIFRKDADGNRLYSHTVWKDGEIVYQRDQFEREIINLRE